MFKCVAPGCNNEESNNIPGISYFGFPTNQLRKEKWMTSLDLAKFETSSSDAVCSNHFRLNSYKIDDNKKWILSPSAVPMSGPQMGDLNKVSKEQQNRLIDLIEEYYNLPMDNDNTLQVNKFKIECGIDWSKIAVILNNMDGSKKPANQWKKSWRNMKYYLRKKEMNLSNPVYYNNKKGVNEISNLTEMDTRILKCINPRPIRCCIPHCDTLNDETATIFEFPEALSLRRRWLNNIGIVKQGEAYKNSGVCHKHFRDCYFLPDTFYSGNVTFKSRNKILCKYALPTIFPEPPTAKKLRTEKFRDENEEIMDIFKSLNAERDEVLNYVGCENPCQPAYNRIALTCFYCKTIASSSLVVFSIPEDKVLRQKWLKNIGITEEDVQELNPGICEKHFIGTDFLPEEYFGNRRGAVVKYKRLRKMLRREAVPTKFSADYRKEAVEILEITNMEYTDSQSINDPMVDNIYCNSSTASTSDNHNDYEDGIFQDSLECFSCNTISDEASSVFPIPNKKSLRRKWLANIELTEAADLDMKFGICEKHFQSDDFLPEVFLSKSQGTLVKYKRLTKALKRNAVPTIFSTKSVDDTIEVFKIFESEYTDNQSTCDESENRPDQSQTKFTSDTENDYDEEMLSSNTESGSGEKVYFDGSENATDFEESSNISSRIVTPIQKTGTPYIEEEIITDNVIATKKLKENNGTDKVLFKYKLDNFVNYVISSLYGIYDEEIMLETQQKISAVCFDAKSKWTAMDK